jgi:peptidoglycan/xylan/chitin deacetylase (PgdA/CDA1 family)
VSRIRVGAALFALAPALAAAPASPPNVLSVPSAGPHFALTFDAHAEAQGARELLALLRARGVRASLFVTGRFVQRFPAIVREALDDGHEIGNHTYSHPHLTTWEVNRRHQTRPEVTREMLQSELAQTAAAIETATGRAPAPLWRAPFGEHNAEIRGWASELGLTHVDWTRADSRSLDALDWVENPRARNYLGAEAMARRLIEFEARSGVPLAGSIILMHLGTARPDAPLIEALPIFLDETDRRGLRPLPVGELMRKADIASMTPPAAAASGSP